eukprot:3867505-Prymnesium_polylepis.1
MLLVECAHRKVSEVGVSSVARMQPGCCCRVACEYRMSVAPHLPSAAHERTTPCCPGPTPPWRPAHPAAGQSPAPPPAHPSCGRPSRVLSLIHI